jgi:CofD-related protein of GAK system
MRGVAAAAPRWGILRVRATRCKEDLSRVSGPRDCYTRPPLLGPPGAHRMNPSSPSQASASQAGAVSQPGAEQGPALLFFSGGSAMRSASRVLKAHTTRSIHLITPFDSGGSSAPLRQAFGILGVGDLRNRLMALAAEDGAQTHALLEAVGHRFDPQSEPAPLREELARFTAGDHPRLSGLAAGARETLRQQLLDFERLMPPEFDLRDASLGNLALTGSYLGHGRNLDAALAQFARLVRARGTVRPTAQADAHLEALHSSGERTLGQHLLGKPEALARGTIRDLRLVSSLTDPEPVEVEADPLSLLLLERADLVCFPMGSFFGSVLANLLPRGVGRAVVSCKAPRVFVPNVGDDPEMRGLSVTDCIRRLVEFASRDVESELQPGDLLDYVLVDSTRLRYTAQLDLDELLRMGVGVIDTDLAGADDVTHDPRKLVEVLLGLAVKRG